MMVTGIAILILLAGRHALRVLQTSQITDAPFECPIRWGKFQIPDDCSSFYNCVSSNAKKKKCPDGQYFDKIFKKCDKQNEVDCNSEVTAPSKITFKCPFSWGPYPYPEDCSRHYLCLFGKPSIKKCEKKMLFDANKKKCEDEEKVDCGSRFNPYGALTSPLPACDSNQRPFLVDGSNCKEYFICVKGKLHKQVCPNRQRFDIHTGFCDWEELVSSCRSPISSFCQKPNGQFVKRGSYCKNYVDCKNGIAIEKVCPTGELFDEELGKCEWSEIANCNKKDPLCPTSNGISMVRGTQCKSYVVCKKGKASIHVCPADRLFNKEIKNCDWPELVDCNEEEITVTNRITTILFRSTSDFHTKATPEQPLTISSKKITGPTPRQTSTVSTIEVTKPTPQQPSTVPTLKITKPTPQQPSTVSSTTIFKQPSSVSSKKITTLAPTSITSTLQSVNTKSSQLTSLTTSEQLTTPIKTSVAVTTFHSILPTTSLRATTPIHTSPPFPEKSTISPLISSIMFNRTSTPINTSFSKSWTNPQEISTAFSTTPNNIPLSHSTSHKSLSTSQTPSETTTISIPKTSSMVHEPITDSSFLTTLRGCTFGDEICEPDDVLCPGEFGEFPHPDTPFYFVHCDHWRPYIKKCPHELHFDPELKVCSWPK